MMRKERDRRVAFWLSFGFVFFSPGLVLVGLDIEIVKSSAFALTGLGVANYFSAPKNDS
jgi:hypothetical protein